MVHEVQLGKNTRLSYSKIHEVLDMPNLIEVQKKSYQWFIEEGLKEVFHDISPITDHSGHFCLEFSIIRWTIIPNIPLRSVRKGMQNMPRR